MGRIKASARVWSYCQDPQSYSAAQGSYRNLDNGNHLISWGTGKTTDIFTTEVTDDGNIEWQLSFSETPDSEKVFDYRAYRSTMIGTAAIPYLCEESDDEAITLYCNWFGHEDEVISYNVYVDDDDPDVFHGNTDTGIYEITDLTRALDYHVRIKAVGNDENEISDYSNEIVVRFESAAVEKELSSGSMGFVLDQNYPNPFNSNTMIRYYLPKSTKVTLRIYNIKGQEIITLLDGMQKSGTNYAVFDAKNLVSGLYFYKIRSENFHSTGKMLLLK
ncbi:MAG: T9SS type A sorting domain-containing protein [Candidatus Electryonea clarkiae]|nr:T9SS type A sorting domain-containing protein [Candidatus Electryonea clarkiae]MDP8288438.1 T9SS type A sorting domain-containing protein [Candidatus Electryonea clarkiae]